MQKLTQPIHVMVGTHIGRTNCIERGCKEYHGSSPSQWFQFYNARGLDKVHEGFKEGIKHQTNESRR